MSDIEALRADDLAGIRSRWANATGGIASNDIRWLLAEVDRLRKDVTDAVAALGVLMTRSDAALELHQPRTDGTCRECDGGAIYPCATARALGVEQ